MHWVVIATLFFSANLPVSALHADTEGCSWSDSGEAIEERSCRGQAGYDFTVESKHFELDGKSIALLSGSIHYWRLPAEYWKRTLEALRDMGLNTVETYVPWSLHQKHPSPESISFDGALDVARFLGLARSLGLMASNSAPPLECRETITC
jgi:hypothetical protein